MDIWNVLSKICLLCSSRKDVNGVYYSKGCNWDDILNIFDKSFERERIKKGHCNIKALREIRIVKDIIRNWYY